MRTGTVSDFDLDGLFGVIDADDGGLLLFNLSAAPAGLRERFHVGVRVTFELEAARSSRAVALRPMAPDGADASRIGATRAACGTEIE